MTIRVLLFGPFADAVSRSAVQVQLPDEPAPAAGQVKAALAEQYPSLAAMLACAVVAVNHQAVRPEHVISETDELAIVGLVGGG